MEGKGYWFAVQEVITYENEMKMVYLPFQIRLKLFAKVDPDNVFWDDCIPFNFSKLRRT